MWIYLLIMFDAVLWRVNQGAVGTFAGSTTSGFMDGAGNNAMFGAPYDICLSPLVGLLYVADFANCNIRVVNIATGQSAAPHCPLSRPACFY